MAATGLGNTFSSRALAGKLNGKLVKGLLGARLDRPLPKPAAEAQHPGPGEWHLSPSWVELLPADLTLSSDSYLQTSGPGCEPQPTHQAAMTGAFKMTFGPWDKVAGGRAPAGTEGSQPPVGTCTLTTGKSR